MLYNNNTKTTIRAFVLFVLTIISPFALTAQGNPDKIEKYIAKYKQLAIDGMDEYGIPASVKLAQGIVESSAGDSRLAKEANNHFGIKCKSNWTGETIAHDDDTVGECFRKYVSTYDSYVDHSQFLSSSSRYDFLFDYDITDYKSWAKGLKSAGYATNPVYADMLIRVIEEYELYKLDLGGNVGKSEESDKIISTSVATVAPAEVIEEVESSDEASAVYKGAIALPDDFAVLKTSPTSVYRNNNVQFVIAEDGDTFDTIAARARKSKKMLMLYNEMSYEPSAIAKGTIIYIATKKSKAANGYLSHSVARGESLHYVSQLYGMKVAKLAALNNFDANYIIKQGQRLRLR